MVRWKPQGDMTLEDMPADLWPDRWNTPVEEEKRRRRSEWLREHDLAGDYFGTWLPAYLAERRRLAGMPPRPLSRRRGPLPAKVRDLLASIDDDQTKGKRNVEADN